MLLQSANVAETTVACCTVEGMRGRVSFVLLQSLIAVERSVAEYTTEAHSVKSVVNTAHVRSHDRHIRFSVEAESCHSCQVMAAMSCKSQHQQIPFPSLALSCS